MKVLLVNPHVPQEVIYGRKSGTAGAVLPPLGILYILSYIRKTRKYDVELLDANATKMDASRVTDYIMRGSYNCVGFSVTTLSYPYAIEIAQKIKTINRQITIIIGGSHAQVEALNIVKTKSHLFDFVCYGEGEIAFTTLMDFLNGERQKESLKGWCYLEDGELIKSPPAEIPENLDLFGHPAEHIPTFLVPLYKEKVFAFRKLPFFTIMASRGCPFKCTFCSTPKKYLDIYNNKMRFHSIEWICDELKLLQHNFGVKEVLFVDDTFNLSKKRLIAFCDEIIKRKIKILWSCNYEANISDYELMRKMKKAGCWQIMIGGESGSDKILQAIRKGFTANKLLEVGETAVKAGLITRVSFILGLPQDSMETINETIEFVKKSSFHFPYFQLYVPLPGTKMYETLGAHGTIINNNPKHRSASRVNYVPNGLSENILMEFFKKSHKAAYFRWKMLKLHIKQLCAPINWKSYLYGLRLLIDI